MEAVFGKVKNSPFFKWIVKFLKGLDPIHLIMVLIRPLVVSLMKTAQIKLDEFIDKIEKAAQWIRKLIKMVQNLIKIFKKIFDAAVKIIRTVVQALCTYPVNLVILGIVLLVTILVFFAILFGRFGAFEGEIVIDFAKMREMNQDKDAYTETLNTAALKESFYDEISDTSFYQTFNLTDMDGGTSNLSNLIIADLASALSGSTYSASDVFAQKKCVTDSPSCVYSGGNLLSLFTYAGISAPQLDNRYTITDASKNPAKYLIQAESLGTYSDSYGMTSYFRDYWNRESSFKIDATFLYELNRWMYDADAKPTTEQLVYPEAFVKPVSFVNDFLRIDVDKNSAGFGSSYTYVTERVTLDDIQDPTSQFYNKYQYEGLIKSTPSDLVYDYVIAGSNSYEVAKDTNSTDQVNIGNPSKYATITEWIDYDPSDSPANKEEGVDGDYTKTIMRFYWVVNPLFMDQHMGQDVTFKNSTSFIDATEINSVSTNYYYYNNGTKTRITATTDAYIGPFLGLTIDAAGDFVFTHKMSYLTTSQTSNLASRYPNREYTYALSNPYVRNSAFILLENSDTPYFINYVVDWTASIKDGSNYIYANEVFYFDGNYYKATSDIALKGDEYDAGGNLKTTFQEARAAGKVAKVQYFVTVPYVIDVELKDYGTFKNRNLNVYPGDYIRFNGSYNIGYSSISNYLTYGTKVADKNAYNSNVATFNCVWHYQGETSWTLSKQTLAAKLTEDTLKLVTQMEDSNLLPTRHYQLAQVVDDAGNVVASSRNLINKTYLKKKTVRPVYRNSDEYWDAFENFVNDDLDKYGYVGVVTDAFGGVFSEQCIIKKDEDENRRMLHYCPAGADDEEDCILDEGTFEERKCSVIKFINQKYALRDLDAKLQNWMHGELGQMDVTAEAMYAILVEFEQHLVETGTQGIEWEYKYYTNTQSEAEEAAKQFEPCLSYYGLKIPDPLGISTYFESDKKKYKDTFDTVVSLNEQRTVSSEYTPISVVSGTNDEYVFCGYCGKTYPASAAYCTNCGQAGCCGSYYFMPNMLTVCTSCNKPVLKDKTVNRTEIWGWKINNLNSIGNNNTIRKVYGESSLELPNYYSNAEVIGDKVNQALKDIYEGVWGSLTISQVVDNTAMVNALFNTDYAENTYGAVHFSYKWVKNGSGVYEIQYDSESLTNFYSSILHAADLPELDGGENETVDDKYQDIRNGDEVWNPDATVYRPAQDSFNSETGHIIGCNPSNNNDPRGYGRVTTRVDPTDYLAMELKSVRDYGLGSVLSYLEGRKVTFFSGLSISETYDLNGVYAWIYSYYEQYGKFSEVGFCSKCDKPLTLKNDGSGNFYCAPCDKTYKSLKNRIEKQAKLAMSGFYTSELFDCECTKASTTCTKCRGLGLMDCDECTATGQDCLKCLGIGTILCDCKKPTPGCSMCQGTGVAKIKLTVCPKCCEHLDNQNVCPDCKANYTNKTYTLEFFVKSLYIFPADSASYDNCTNCGGDGKVGQSTTCSICNGTGKVNGLETIGEEFSTADLAALADGLNALQGTGESIFKYKKTVDGVDKYYWFTVTYATGVNDVNTDTNDLLKAPQGYIVMMKPNANNPDSKWIKTNINVAIPYITEQGLESIFFESNLIRNDIVQDMIKNKRCPYCTGGVLAGILGLECSQCGYEWMNADGYSDAMARAEANNQFFNPKAYHLAWYDYATDNLSTANKISNLITRAELVKYYDNNTALALRAIFNQTYACALCACGGNSDSGSGSRENYSEDCTCNCHNDITSLENVSNIKTKFWASNHILSWIADKFNIGNLFNGAGRYTSDYVITEMYRKYGDHVYRIDLIDESRTSKMYMIEEAVTFLGNFVYTYDTELLIAGDVYGNEKIVSDLVFADRGYVISNYIFRVPVYTTKVVWNDNSKDAEVQEVLNITTEYPFAEGSADRERLLESIYAFNPCYNQATEFDPTGKPWYEVIGDYGKKAWGELKEGAAYVLGDVLHITDPANINPKQVTPHDYCASNYAYKEHIYFDYYQTYTYSYRSSTQSGLSSCKSSTSAEIDAVKKNGDPSKPYYTCSSYQTTETYIEYETRVETITTTDPTTGETYEYEYEYVVPVTKTREVTKYKKTSHYWNKKTDEKTATAVKKVNRWNLSTYTNKFNYNNTQYYISIKEVVNSDSSKVEYQWFSKWGYTYKFVKLDNAKAIHIDTYDEVEKLYDYLVTAGYQDTASKLFIGMQVMDDVNSISWFGIDDNKVDLNSAHWYTISENHQFVYDRSNSGGLTITIEGKTHTFQFSYAEALFNSEFTSIGKEYGWDLQVLAFCKDEMLCPHLLSYEDFEDIEFYCIHCHESLTLDEIDGSDCESAPSSVDYVAKGICVKTPDSPTSCTSASAGDDEDHYNVYSSAYLLTAEKIKCDFGCFDSNNDGLCDVASCKCYHTDCLRERYLDSTVVNALKTIGNAFSNQLEIKDNLRGRYGALLGNNRLDSNGNLVATKWWEDNSGQNILDENGNLDDLRITKSTDFAQIGAGAGTFGAGTFELTKTDLARISRAIQSVYGPDYNSLSYLTIGDSQYEDTEDNILLGDKASDFTWNLLSPKELNMHNNGQLSDGSYISDPNATGGGTKAYADVSITSFGNQCYVNFIWCPSTTLNGDKEEIYEKDKAYASRDITTYKAGRHVVSQRYIATDWAVITVGVEAGNRSTYGTPIALETQMFGSYKQVAPVETGSYFNEEVYSDWMNRMNPSSGSTEKTNYLLSYREATSTYLYDYLMNFETYIPLGVMSDADLVNRGVDAYTSIQANDNRAFSYTASYTGQLKQYLEVPGWINIVDNYNTKSPLLSKLISSLVPVNQTQYVDKDTMVQYVAGIIETTIQYAPSWTIEYYNEQIDVVNDAIDAENQEIIDEAKKNGLEYEDYAHLLKPLNPYIERSSDNFSAIEDALYSSLFAPDTTDVDYRQVRLLMEDGTRKVYDMLYVGPGAILALPLDHGNQFVGYNMLNENFTISTDHFADGIAGFGSVTLNIGKNVDERLDLQKSLNYVTTKFGKLLYKYGNVASATMAYFYGETYWDNLIECAASQGISTGPEWKTDNEEFIDYALNQSILGTQTNVRSKFPLLSTYDEDLYATIFTSDVVEYNLSYVSDSSERLYLIRNTTSSLGDAIKSVGANADAARQYYNIISEDGIELYLGPSEEVVHTIKIEDMSDIARKLNVDLGVIMALIMSESGGDPCYGLGTCTVDSNGDYVLNTLSAYTFKNHKMGLFGLSYKQERTDLPIILETSEGKTTVKAVISRTDLPENCNQAQFVTNDAVKDLVLVHKKGKNIKSISGSSAYITESYTYPTSGYIQATITDKYIVNEYTDKDGVYYPTTYNIVLQYTLDGVKTLRTIQVSESIYNETVNGIAKYNIGVSVEYKPDSNHLKGLYQSNKCTRTVTVTMYRYKASEIHYKSVFIAKNVDVYKAYEKKLDEDAKNIKREEKGKDPKTKHNDRWDYLVANVNSFTEADGRYSHGGTDSVIYIAAILANMYESNDFDALSTIFEYHHGKETLSFVKKEAVKKGYGNNWFAYYCSITPSALNKTLKTLSYYDATLESDNYLEIQYSATNPEHAHLTTEYKDDNYTGKTIVETYYDRTYEKMINETKTYKSCALTNTGSCERTFTASTYNQGLLEDYCTVSSRTSYVQSTFGHTDVVIKSSDISATNRSYVHDTSYSVTYNPSNMTACENYEKNLATAIGGVSQTSNTWGNAAKCSSLSGSTKVTYKYTIKVNMENLYETWNDWHGPVYFTKENNIDDLRRWCEDDGKAGGTTLYEYVYGSASVNKGSFDAGSKVCTTYRVIEGTLDNLPTYSSSEYFMADFDINLDLIVDIIVQRASESGVTKEQLDNSPTLVKYYLEQAANDERWKDQNVIVYDGGVHSSFTSVTVQPDPVQTIEMPAITWNFAIYGESGQTAQLVVPSGATYSSSVSNEKSYVTCSFSWTHKITDTKSNVEACKIDATQNIVEVKFEYDDINHAEGMYRCTVDKTLKINYDNQWDISINGFSVSAFSFFGDTSAFNEYKQDKLGMQNTGIEVFIKETGNNREMVDIIVQSTFADETNFILNQGEYSLFAFFETYTSYAEDLARSWFQVFDDLPEENLGKGTPNEFSKNEIWDLPVIYRFSTSPTNNETIVIKEHFGREKDDLNGGTKLNDGIVIEHNRGAKVYAGIDGTITGIGYNMLYGNYVEITADMNSVFDTTSNIVSTVNGQRYEITGVKIVYGHLLSEEYGGYVPGKNSTVYASTTIGNVGTSGRSGGDSLYMAIYIQANVLDENDNTEYNTGWIAVDPEPYFTSKFTTGTNYTVYYN